MENLITIILLLIFSAYLFIQVRGWWQNYQQLEDRLKEHYKEQGLEVLSISKLNMTERIKYGVPVSPFISLYQSSFGMFSVGNKTVCRSVETQSESGSEQIRYVEVSFTGKGISVNEFDVYEF